MRRPSRSAATGGSCRMPWSPWSWMGLQRRKQLVSYQPRPWVQLPNRRETGKVSVVQHGAAWGSLVGRVHIRVRRAAGPAASERPPPPASRGRGIAAPATFQLICQLQGVATGEQLRKPTPSQGLGHLPASAASGRKESGAHNTVPKRGRDLPEVAQQVGDHPRAAAPVSWKFWALPAEDAVRPRSPRLQPARPAGQPTASRSREGAPAETLRHRGGEGRGGGGRVCGGGGSPGPSRESPVESVGAEAGKAEVTLASRFASRAPWRSRGPGAGRWLLSIWRKH